MRLVGVFLILALAGCTIQVVDSRLTREEVSSALKQRDQAILGLAEAIGKLQKKKK